MKMVVGNKYKWKNDHKVLCYTGKVHGWYQFSLNGVAWCAILDSDLWLLEEVFDE